MKRSNNLNRLQLIDKKSYSLNRFTSEKTYTHEEEKIGSRNKIQTGKIKEETRNKQHRCQWEKPMVNPHMKQDLAYYSH